MCIELKTNFTHRYKPIECRDCPGREIPIPESIVCETSDDIYELVKDELLSSDREILLAIMLSENNQVIEVVTICTGGLEGCPVALQELLRSAVTSNASSIALCHNHLSGNLTPILEELTLSDNILDVRRNLRIELADHLIITHEGYRSVFSPENSKEGLNKVNPDPE